MKKEITFRSKDNIQTCFVRTYNDLGTYINCSIKNEMQSLNT